MGALLKGASAVLQERSRVVMSFMTWNVVVLLCTVLMFLGASRHAPWHANKLWHEPDAFPRCSMDACFNFSRCDRALLIYTYNDPVPKGLHAPMYLESLPGSEWHTTDPDQACLFFYFSDTMANRAAWTKPAFTRLPHWNGGLNHVIVTFADRWRDTNPAPESVAMASLLSTNLHLTTYRPAFDVAVPLPRSNPFSIADLYHLQPFERHYFLTFKGKRYLSREGVFREKLRAMHNGHDVVVVETCNGKTNTKLLSAHPELGSGCKEGQAAYDSYDYMALMNSTFALAPAGRSPASYRMFEVMSNGAIPVLVADNYVKPFETLIQWQYCLVQFPTNEVERILPTLRGLSRKEVEGRQRYCKRVYEEFLKDDATLVRTVVRSFKERFMGMMPNFPLGEDFMKGHN
jgi:glucuronyl/N-acetylglucosaminyl transferase EXT1